MMPRFNIAAVPIDPVMRGRFFNAAASMKDAAYNYTLAENKSLPHVTLTQFRAPSETQALALVDRFLGEEILLRTAGIYHSRAEEPGHAGNFWVGYVLRNNNRLISLQAEVVAHLQNEKIETFTKTGNSYFPHFTVVQTTRIIGDFDEAKVFSDNLVKADIACRIRLGLSDENGQFMTTLDGLL